VIREITISTRKQTELIDISPRIGRLIAEAGFAEGVCLVYSPHTTAALMINERADPAVARDIGDFLEEAIPERRDWAHVEGNSPAHVKAALIGESVWIPIADGRPLLGIWQGVFFCEFDGPRTRRVVVRIVP